MKLAALIYTKHDQTMLKLWDDESSAPVAHDRHAEAIQAVSKAGYRSFGIWLKREALVWAINFEDFEQAWGEPVLKAPCRYGKRGRARRHKVGDGYLRPTRSNAQVRRLAQEYPWFAGDLLFVPVELLYKRKVQLEKRDKVNQDKITAWLKSPDRRPTYKLIGADFRPH